ncbi:Protein involved in dna replication, partial [Globisporangium splendens]
MEQLAQQHSAHRPLARASVASPESGASWDFLLQQVAFVQTRLKALWQLKSSNASGIQVPFSWVLSKVRALRIAYSLLRLIEEYPDGVTEAIIVTELMMLLQRKVNASNGDNASSKKILNADDIARVLSEMEDSNDAVPAKLVRYDGYKLSLDTQSSVTLQLEMYLHQRFRSCAAFLGSQPQFHSKSGAGFPFQSGRSFVFTNAKVMERKDIGTSSANGVEETKSRDAQEETYYLLPTQYLALHLDASNALDQVFARQSINLGRLDQLAAMQDQAILQQLVVKVKACSVSCCCVVIMGNGA